MLIAKLTLFTTLFLIGCTNLNRKNPEPERSPSSSAYPDVAADFKFEQLVDSVNRAPLPTLENALANLRNDFPSLFYNPALAYYSLSLHKASFKEPRVILYGRSAKLIVTYNGHDSLPGGAAFEVMSFNENNGFEFREVAFLNNGASGYISPNDLDSSLSTRSVQVSKPNISKCMQCHGPARPAPIWDSYFFWPGFYGSQDDESMLAVRGVGGDERVFEIRQKELPKLQSFYASSVNSPRYKYVCLDTGPNQAKPCDLPLREVMTSNPNLTLTGLLYDLNFRDIARRLILDRRFWPYRFAMAHVIACNQPQTIEAIDSRLRSVIPAGIYTRNQATLGTVSQVITRNILSRVDYLLEKESRLKETLRQNLSFAPNFLDFMSSNENKTDVLRTIAPNLSRENTFLLGTLSSISEDKLPGTFEFLLKPIGIDTESWGPNVRRINEFGAGYSSSQALLGPLIRAIAGRESLPIWRNLLQGHVTAADCHDLQVRSLAELNAY